MRLLTSELLIKKIKEFEGLRLEAYQDAAGVWTIGYGHTYDVAKGDKVSEYFAEEMLMKDIAIAEKQVRNLGVCKTQGQLDALVDFVFNLGIKKLETSTLLRTIRAGMPREIIAKEFRRWVYANGQRVKGLLTRRHWEIERFYDNTDTLDEVRQAIENPQTMTEEEEQAILDSLDEKPY